MYNNIEELYDMIELFNDVPIESAPKYLSHSFIGNAVKKRLEDPEEFNRMVAKISDLRKTSLDIHGFLVSASRKLEKDLYNYFFGPVQFAVKFTIEK